MVQLVLRQRFKLFEFDQFNNIFPNVWEFNSIVFEKFKYYVHNLIHSRSNLWIIAIKTMKL